ncbi:hypothetical protein D9M71_38450 [compost metagenome]
MVFHAEHLRLHLPLFLRGPGRRRGLELIRCGDAGQVDPETAADIRRAAEAHFAPHQLRQFSAQHQADTGARNSGVLPAQALEGLEQHGLLFLTEARPTVGHPEAHSRRTNLVAHAHHALRAVVFHRIGEQVQHHLAQTAGIGHHMQRRHRRRHQLQLQVARLELGLDQLTATGQQRADIHRLELQLLATILDARQVEDVVHQRGEVTAGVDDLLRVVAFHLAVFLAFRLQGDELGEAVDGVERRAQLVTHAGQEAALGLARRLGLAAGDAQFFLHLLEAGDVHMGTGHPQGAAIGVALQHLAAAEQPGVTPCHIGETIFGVEVVLVADREQHPQATYPLHVFRVHTLVEFGEGNGVAAQPEALDEASAHLHRQGYGIHFPEAFRGAFQYQVEVAPGLQTFLLTGLQLRTAELYRFGQCLQFSDAAARRRRAEVALADAFHHPHDRCHGRGQFATEAPRPRPHPGEEQRIEEAEPGDQQITDLLVARSEAVGFLEDVGLVHHHHQPPAGLRNLRPGHQLLAPAQLHFLHIALAGCHGLQQRLHLAVAGQVEVLGLEHLAAHRLVIGETGQLAQTEVALPRFRQCHDAVVAAHQHRVALPWHLQAADLAEHLPHGDIQPHHPFEEIAPVDRGDRRHHPAEAGRVQVNVGPDRLALRVVLGVSEVIEVVVGYHHVMGILLGRHEEGIDAVVAVPTVEVDRRHQRVGLADRTHQRVHLGQAQRLLVVLLLHRRAAGIEGSGATVVAAGVEHAVGTQHMALPLQLIRREAAILQRPAHRIAKQPRGHLDALQAHVDHLALAQHRAAQILQRTSLQVLHLGIANCAVGQQINRDQHRFDQNQRDQGTLYEGAPDPLAQGSSGRTRHGDVSAQRSS